MKIPDFEKRICPYCYSDLTNHVWKKSKWITLCPYCKKKMIQGGYTNYKFRDIKLAFFVTIVLFILFAIYRLFIK